MELERAVGAFGEHAVQHEGVEVDVQLQAAPEPLDHRDGSTPAVAHAPAACSSSVEAEHGADGDAEDRTAELVVPGLAGTGSMGTATHQPRAAERAVLHRIVRENLETFLREATLRDAPVVKTACCTPTRRHRLCRG